MSVLGALAFVGTGAPLAAMARFAMADKECECFVVAAAGVLGGDRFTTGFAARRLRASGLRAGRFAASRLTVGSRAVLLAASRIGGDLGATFEF